MLYEYALFLLTTFLMSSSTEYLEANLLPLIESIKPKTPDSFLLKACGLDGRPSTQSVSITIGTRLEKFWNKVFSDSPHCTNHIEHSDRVDVNGRTRQIDHYFSVPDLGADTHLYLESKCNVNFDTEKIRASNEKIQQITETLSNRDDREVQSGYFVPVLRNIPTNIAREYEALGVGVFDVEDVISWMGIDGCPFTPDEYFDFFKERLAPIITRLLDGVPVNKPAHRVLHGRLDLL